MQIDIHYIHEKERAVLKRHPFVKREAHMLSLLGKYVNVPEVYHVDNEKIIMQYIDNDSPTDESKAAHTIAKLHKQSADKFGLDFDTTIGPFLQPNLQSDSWIDFYTTQRLLHMAKEALNEEAISLKHFKQIEQICDKLPSLIPDLPQISLLHGDIWSGNILWHRQELYFIDPALYFGHNEMELAFILMFNTFGKKFFDTYNEIVPIEKEFFEYRYQIYQIYPYLVHVRIYGSIYLNALEKLLSRFV